MVVVVKYQEYNIMFRLDKSFRFSCSIHYSRPIPLFSVRSSISAHRHLLQARIIVAVKTAHGLCFSRRIIIGTAPTAVPPSEYNVIFVVVGELYRSISDSMIEVLYSVCFTLFFYHLSKCQSLQYFLPIIFNCNLFII